MINHIGSKATAGGTRNPKLPFSKASDVQLRMLEVSAELTPTLMIVPRPKHPKMDGWKRNFLLRQTAYFEGRWLLVSGRVLFSKKNPDVEVLGTRVRSL